MKILDFLDLKMKSLDLLQVKKCILACELIKEPKYVFWDDVFNGLDAKTTLKLSVLLKSSSKYDITFILTVDTLYDVLLDHFDTLLLLSYGETLYMGDISACLPYFESKGLLPKENEDFNIFIMRMLDCDANSIDIDYDISDVLEQTYEDVLRNYGYEDTQQEWRSKNEPFQNNKFSWDHFILLMQRQFKKFSFLALLILIVCMVLFCFFAQNINLQFYYLAIPEKFEKLKNLKYDLLSDLNIDVSMLS